MIFAAGNIGEEVRSTCTMSSPATAKNVLAVGASTSGATRFSITAFDYPDLDTSGIDTVAPFSSTGPTADGRIKPEVVAPGDMVRIAPRSLSLVDGMLLCLLLVLFLCFLCLFSRARNDVHWDSVLAGGRFFLSWGCYTPFFMTAANRCWSFASLGLEGQLDPLFGWLALEPATHLVARDALSTAECCLARSFRLAYRTVGKASLVF